MSRRARKVLREHEMKLRLHAECMRHQSDAAAAKSLGVSRGHLSHVLAGRKPITDRLALALGYERQDCFVPYEERE